MERTRVFNCVSVWRFSRAMNLCAVRCLNDAKAAMSLDWLAIDCRSILSFIKFGEFNHAFTPSLYALSPHDWSLTKTKLITQEVDHPET